MRPLDMWLVGFGLRCGALLFLELAAFLFVVPTLFNLHSDLADLAAAVTAIGALVGGVIWGVSLTREMEALVSEKDE